jgi:hypothetical protein
VRLPKHSISVVTLEIARTPEDHIDSPAQKLVKWVDESGFAIHLRADSKDTLPPPR